MPPRPHTPPETTKPKFRCEVRASERKGLGSNSNNKHEAVELARDYCVADIFIVGSAGWDWEPEKFFRGL